MAETPASAGSEDPAGRAEPDRTYTFRLLMMGDAVGSFTDCSGLGVKVDLITHRVVRNGPSARIPGRGSTYSEVVLRHGLSDSRDLFEWLLGTSQGKVSRRDVSIALVESGGSNEVMRWNLYAAWPSDWRGRPLDVPLFEMEIESLTLVFDRIERV